MATQRLRVVTGAAAPAALGFEAVWVTVEEVVRVNTEIFAGGSTQPWAARELAVLRALGGA